MKISFLIFIFFSSLFFIHCQKDSSSLTKNADLFPPKKENSQKPTPGSIKGIYDLQYLSCANEEILKGEHSNYIEGARLSLTSSTFEITRVILATKGSYAYQQRCTKTITASIESENDYSLKLINFQETLCECSLKSDETSFCQSLTSYPDSWTLTYEITLDGFSFEPILGLPLLNALCREGEATKSFWK